MESISLNDYLGTKSNWPRRFFGWEKFGIDRDVSQIETEYNVDRYEPLFNDASLRSIEDCKAREFQNMGMNSDDPHFISYGEEIFRCPTRVARLLWNDLIKSTVERFATGQVCELGCGYGYNLAQLGGTGYGGDYSENAVKLGRRLGTDLRQFNYYQHDDYQFIREGSTVLTVHSIEQIPSARSFVEAMSQQRDKINEVIHLEPCWLDQRSTLLGSARNKFNELIQHNNDLVSLLQQHPDIEIVHFEPDIFGIHPLNSTIRTVWRFRK
jgi:SAM-dependent methyltransferase